MRPSQRPRKMVVSKGCRRRWRIRIVFRTGRGDLLRQRSGFEILSRTQSRGYKGPSADWSQHLSVDAPQLGCCRDFFMAGGVFGRVLDCNSQWRSGPWVFETAD